MSRRSASISEAKHEKPAQTNVQTDGNSFDVYGNEETAESERIHPVPRRCTHYSSVKYRTMVWWKAAALMLAETVSLGVRV